MLFLHFIVIHFFLGNYQWVEIGIVSFNVHGMGWVG